MARSLRFVKRRRQQPSRPCKLQLKRLQRTAKSGTKQTTSPGSKNTANPGIKNTAESGSKNTANPCSKQNFSSKQTAKSSSKRIADLKRKKIANSSNKSKSINNSHTGGKLKSVADTRHGRDPGGLRKSHKRKCSQSDSNKSPQKRLNKSECEAHQEPEVLFLLKDKDLSENGTDCITADMTLTEGLTIKASKVTPDKMGVFSTDLLPKRLCFGPMKGEYKDKHTELSTSYCWKVYKERVVNHYIDVHDPLIANWMRYVHHAPSGTPHNLDVFQHEGRLYFRTSENIPRGQELLLSHNKYYVTETELRQNQAEKAIDSSTKPYVSCPVALDAKRDLTASLKSSHHQVQNDSKQSSGVGSVSKLRKDLSRSSVDLPVDLREFVCKECEITYTDAYRYYRHCYICHGQALPQQLSTNDENIGIGQSVNSVLRALLNRSKTSAGRSDLITGTPPTTDGAPMLDANRNHTKRPVLLDAMNREASAALSPESKDKQRPVIPDTVRHPRPLLPRPAVVSPGPWTQQYTDISRVMSPPPHQMSDVQYSSNSMQQPWSQLGQTYPFYVNRHPSYAPQAYGQLPYSPQPFSQQPYTSQAYTNEAYTSQPYNPQQNTTQFNTQLPHPVRPQTAPLIIPQPVISQPSNPQPSNLQPSTLQLSNPQLTELTTSKLSTSQTSALQLITSQLSTSQPSSAQQEARQLGTPVTSDPAVSVTPSISPHSDVTAASESSISSHEQQDMPQTVSDAQNILKGALLMKPGKRLLSKLYQKKKKADLEKRFKCELCDKLFAHQANLRRHVKLHNGEKPYVCSVCQRGFGENADLLSHMHLHTGERPNKCYFCPKAFASTGSRGTHIRRWHKLENAARLQLKAEGMIVGRNSKSSTKQKLQDIKLAPNTSSPDTEYDSKIKQIVSFLEK